MSRIGKLPIEIPEKVNVLLKDNTVNVKGPKGELSQEFDSRMQVNIEGNQLTVDRTNDNRDERSLHGLTRSIIESMIIGVEKGFEKKLEMVGVGYNAKVQGKNIVLEVGFSHPVTLEALGDIQFEVEKNTNITVKGINKQLVGEMAAKIRAVRAPEPYKGKGIKYADEKIRRKVGKTG